jgi:MinD-like ATPase involved in chromosome partitioning or flagellar assembly
VLVFATSDKGGTGRSVTSSNILYRTALTGADVCYLDFDFGSPTAGSIFAIDGLTRGTDSKAGLHSYLLGRAPKPEA